MKICFVTGKRGMYGNNVSHANNKTRRRFEANIQDMVLHSKILGSCSVKITPKGVKTIELKGGLDAFLANNNRVYGIEGKKLVKQYLLATKK